MPKYQVSTFKRNQAKILRHALTDAEHKLWRLLRSRQLEATKFRRQVPLGPWIVDFVSLNKGSSLKQMAASTWNASAIKRATSICKTAAFAFCVSGTATFLEIQMGCFSRFWN